MKKSEVSIRDGEIDFHFFYKEKIEEAGKKRLKARLCPHGIRDKIKKRNP